MHDSGELLMILEADEIGEWTIASARSMAEANDLKLNGYRPTTRAAVAEDFGTGITKFLTIGRAVFMTNDAAVFGPIEDFI